MITQLKRLNLDESGVAMTEYVITLPAFILCFIAISQLAPMLSYGTVGAIHAGQDVWQQAVGMEQHKDLGRGPGAMASEMNPDVARDFSSAGAASGLDMLTYTGEGNDSTWAATMTEGVTIGALTGTGDFGEFYGRMKPIDVFGPSAEGMPKQSIGVSGKELYGSKNQSEAGNSLFAPWSLSGVILRVISGLGDLKGARYGIIAGSAEGKFETSAGPFTVRRYSTVLAPPTGVESNLLHPTVFFSIHGVPLQILGFSVPKFDGLTTQYSEIFGLQKAKLVTAHHQTAPDPW